MPKSRTKRGRLTFKVDSSLLFQLGEQLVAKPSIALAELVKNSYDADASEVQVSFRKIGKVGGIVVIEDNGHGMTFDEVRKGWMTIASAHKRDDASSRKYQRPLTGAKGIGRFAARRLGTYLKLESTAVQKSGEKEKVTVDFDWQKRFKSGKMLNRIPVKYTREAVDAKVHTGVTLTITGVRDAWTVDEMSALRGDLLGLQSPFPDLIPPVSKENSTDRVRDPGFNVALAIEGVEGLEDFSGGLDESFFRAAWARLDGTINAKGIATYRLKIRERKTQSRISDQDSTYSELGLEGAKFRIYFVVAKNEFLAGTGLKLRQVLQKAREEAGVRIYLDGFRVFPYGDQGDDWLQLDQFAAKNIDIAQASLPPQKMIEMAAEIPGRAYLLIPKNDQVFGAVSISQKKNSSIQLNISRERLLETPTLVKLRRFVQNGIYWMTLKYADFRNHQNQAQRRKKNRTIDELLDEIQGAVADNPEASDTKLQGIVDTIARVRQQVKEEASEHISELSLIRILASSGTTISLMNHQLQALISAIYQTEQDLIRLRPQISPDGQSTYDDIIAQVSEWHEMIKLQVSQLGFLLAPESRQRRKRHVLYEIVEGVRRPMSYYMKTYHVAFENNVARNLRTPPIYRAELYAMLINIFSNALKAVYNQATRRIAVEADRANGFLRIRLLDTGVGISAQQRQVAFVPFKTTSLPNPLLGVGTGLGLKVVRDMVEMYGGTANFVDVARPWKTCIELALPEKEF